MVHVKQDLALEQGPVKVASVGAPPCGCPGGRAATGAPLWLTLLAVTGRAIVRYPSARLPGFGAASHPLRLSPMEVPEVMASACRQAMKEIWAIADALERLL